LTLSKTIQLLPGYDPRDQAGDCTFDEAAAQRAIDFIHECIKHAKGKEAAKPFVLEPWEQAIVGNLFGWKRADGTRRYRESLIYVAKKNGKTALIAAILLLMLTTDDELGAELYSAAASRDQAALIFSHAAGMVKQETELSSRLTVYGAKGGSQQRAIVYDATMSSYKCLSADANTADGANPSFVAIDELHRHRDGELADVLQKSTATRKQPLVIYTSTADYNRPSVCNAMLKRARQVRDNKGNKAEMGYDPAFLPVVYECDASDDWESPETWKKANPNLGVTIPEDFLARECQKAKENPSELNNFLRLHLNIVTDADETWLDMSRWDECNSDPIDEDALAGRECFTAIDLSSKVDTTCVGHLFPPTDEDPLWRYLLRCFIPEENAHEREKRDRVPYTTWARKGWITTTPGESIDYDFIEEQIRQDAAKFVIKDVSFDPWNARQTATHLQNDGMTVYEFGQGFRSMSEPSKELEAIVMQRKLAHGGNPVLKWMAGNTMIERDPAGNIKPSKKKSTERIDGIVTLVMALGRAVVTPVVTNNFAWSVA
jgi:phage terminase large subunit-like protein